MADGRLRACLHWVVQQCICSVFDTYAASVSSRSGARHAWIYAGSMLSILATPTKMNINPKVYSGVYGDTATCCHGCCHHWATQILTQTVLRTSKLTATHP